MTQTSAGLTTGAPRDFGKPLRILGWDVDFRTFSIALAAMQVVPFSAFLWAVLSMPDGNRGLVLVAVAAWMTGCLLAFLYSTFGKQEQVFGSFTTLINTFVGGLAARDLFAKDSAIRQCLALTAQAVGLADKSALVALVAIGFAILGFFGQYYFKIVVLDVLHQSQEVYRTRLGTSIEAMKNLPDRMLINPLARQSDVLYWDCPTVVAAQGYADMLPSERHTPDSDLLLANSNLAAGRLHDAELGFRRILEATPQNALALHGLATTLFKQSKASESVAYLQQLMPLPDAPTNTRLLYAIAVEKTSGPSKDVVDQVIEHLKGRPGDIVAREWARGMVVHLQVDGKLTSEQTSEYLNRLSSGPMSASN